MKATAFFCVAMFVLVAGCTKTGTGGPASPTTQEETEADTTRRTAVPAPMTKEEIQAEPQVQKNRQEDRSLRTAVPAPLSKEEIRKAGEK